MNEEINQTNTEAEVAIRPEDKEIKEIAAQEAEFAPQGEQAEQAVDS